MANIPVQGMILHSEKGQQIQIDRLCAEGSMGMVFDATVNGEKKYFRWFKGGAEGHSLKLLWESTRQKAQQPSPGKFLFWPEDLTAFSEEGFGYVTRPEMKDGASFRDVVNGKYRMDSWRERVNVALNLVMAFSQLHLRGYCISEPSADFWFSTRNGSVLLPETEAVVPVGMKRNGIFAPRFASPELVLGGAPDGKTDLHLLSVYLFILFCGCHPLEGVRHLAPVLTPAVEKRLYGEDPLFVFDTQDASNRPHPVIHRGAEAAWNALPGYIQALFQKAFCAEGLHNPDSRPGEIQWLHALVRMKNDWVTCECGAESFDWGREGSHCSRCGKPLFQSLRLVLENIGYAMPVGKGKKLFRGHTAVCAPDRLLEPVAILVEDPQRPGLLRLKNITDREWKARTPSGVEKTVRQEESVPVQPGITLFVDGAQIRIEKMG